MPQEYEIKDCPCCGSEQVLLSPGTHTVLPFVKCLRCALQISVPVSLDEIVEKWNRRWNEGISREKALEEAVKCLNAVKCRNDAQGLRPEERASLLGRAQRLIEAVAHGD